MGMLFMSFTPFSQREAVGGGVKGLGVGRYPGKMLKLKRKKNCTWNVLRNSVFSVITTPTYKEPSPRNSF